MSRAPFSRLTGLIEALAMFATVMAYIWKLRFFYPKFWILPLALILISHLARRERPRDLGFRVANFGACVRSYAPALIALALALLIVGLLLGTMRPISTAQAFGSFALYLPWGLFQEYLLNGYFLKRLDTALSPDRSAILTSILFSMVHLPNWFLMLVTLVGGYAAILVYRKYRNLYFLGLAHAILGFLLFLTVPDSVSHHLNVGPLWRR